MGKSADPANQGAILKTVPRTRLPFSDVVNAQPPGMMFPTKVGEPRAERLYSTCVDYVSVDFFLSRWW